MSTLSPTTLTVRNLPKGQGANHAINGDGRCFGGGDGVGLVGGVQRAEADYIDAVGFADSLFYNGITYHPSKPVDAKFFYVNDDAPDPILVSYVTISFDIAGQGFTYSMGDDGFGNGSVGPKSIFIETTNGGYFDTVQSVAVLNATAPENMRFRSGMSYILPPGNSNYAFAYEITKQFNDDGEYIGDLTNFSVSFVIDTIGVNAIATVPLPATALLFAVALLALGGVGYARRQVSPA